MAKKKLIFKGNGGLGDGVYCWPIINHFAKDNDLIVKSDWPLLYENIKNVECIPRKAPGYGLDIRVSYHPRKSIQNTTQYQDLLISADLGKDSIPIHMDWRDKDFFEGTEKTRVVFIPPYRSMQRTDGFAKDIDITTDDMEKVHSMFKRHDVVCYLTKQNMDLKNYIDILYSADIIVCQCGHGLTFAQAFGKKLLIILNERMRNNKIDFVRHLTPAKLIINPDKEKYIYTDWKDSKIENTIKGLL